MPNADVVPVGKWGSGSRWKMWIWPMSKNPALYHIRILKTLPHSNILNIDTSQRIYTLRHWACNNAPSLDNAPSHVWCIIPFNYCILNHEHSVTSTQQFASISQYCASASTCSLNNLQTMHCWWLMHLELFDSTIAASQLFHIRVFKNTVSFSRAADTASNRHQHLL